MEMTQNQKHLYTKKLVAWWLWEPANPDCLAVDSNLVLTNLMYYKKVSIYLYIYYYKGAVVTLVKCTKSKQIS